MGFALFREAVVLRRSLHLAGGAKKGKNGCMRLSWRVLEIWSSTASLYISFSGRNSGFQSKGSCMYWAILVVCIIHSIMAGIIMTSALNRVYVAYHQNHSDV